MKDVTFSKRDCDSIPVVGYQMYRYRGVDWERIHGIWHSDHGYTVEPDHGRWVVLNAYRRRCFEAKTARECMRWASWGQYDSSPQRSKQ